MAKTDREILELCKSWFEDIVERSDRLTTGNVSHGSKAIHGVAKNYAEYVDEHLHNRWKPSDEQLYSLDRVLRFYGKGSAVYDSVKELLEQLKKLREE